MKKFYFITILVFALIVQLNAQTWTSLTTPSTTGVAHLAVANNKLFMAASTGIFSTTDAISWDTSCTGMTVTVGYTFSTNIYNYNNVMFSGAMAAVYKSVDFGANWTKMTGAGTSASADNTSIYVKGDTIIAGWGSSTGVKTSTDGGLTWAFKALPVVDKDIVELNGAIYIKTQSGIYKSTDLCANFTMLTGGLPTFSGSTGALVESNGVLITTIYSFGTYISSDEGVTWTEISTPEGLTSTNGGSLAVLDGNVYLGCTAGKVFTSSNDGSTWTEITGTGINSMDQIKCFAIYNGDLYAGATYALYKTPLSTSVNEIQAENSYSVYPNPANEQLSISFDLKNSVVNYISLTDLSGKIVKHELVQPNQQQITISTNDLKNGIYFLNTDNALLAPKKIVVSH